MSCEVAALPFQAQANYGTLNKTFSLVSNNYERIEKWLRLNESNIF